MTRTPSPALPSSADLTPAALTSGGKLLLLAGNALPLLTCLGLGMLAWQLRRQPAVAVGSVVATLYLLPPLLCRLLMLILPLRRSVIPIGSRDFFVWWLALNLQVLFCRFLFLEELLRIVPGLYSLWLRLWGAKIGRLTYWAPGVQILDRQFVHIGDDVTFGAAVRINPHVILREGGRTVLVLAAVSIGDRSSVGGYSLLTAGATIGAGESPRAFTILPPFSRVEGGKRIKSDALFGQGDE